MLTLFFPRVFAASFSTNLGLMQPVMIVPSQTVQCVGIFVEYFTIRISVGDQYASFCQ